jgi:hypothetical protein
VYDAKEGRLISQDTFHDVSEAMGAFAKSEWEYRDPFQVLLFSADSIETVRSTHPHYFTEDDEGYWTDSLGVPPIPA